MDKLLEAKVYRSIPIQEIRESGCMIYKILQEADVRTSENSLVPNEELSRVMRCVGQQRRLTEYMYIAMSIECHSAEQWCARVVPQNDCSFDEFELNESET